MNCANAFSKTFLPSDERPKRAVISCENIKQIQEVCLSIADERRLLIALISDTGLRLSEAIGLEWDDIQLVHEYPHLEVKPHTWRRLKTNGSKRLIPLVGASLASIKIMHCQRTNRFLFKSYANENGCNGNSCSATLNKWLKRYAPDAVIHSFRHSFRDRLRNSGVQSEIIDQLGGWANQSVGRGYGKGYNLRTLSRALKQGLIDDNILRK